MTHELTHNPIKLRVVDLLTGEWNKSYIFIGTVPDDIEKELKKTQSLFNKNGKIYPSTKLRKFYGSNWNNKLGLIKQKKSGGNEEAPAPEDDLLEGLGVDVADQVSMADENIDLTNTSDDDQDNKLDDTTNTDLDDELENELDDPEIDNTKASQIQTDDDFNLLDMGIDGISDKVEITIDDLKDVADPEQKEVKDVLEDVEKTETIEKTGTIEFVYNTSVYPADSIMTFKKKIYQTTNIPIYRQHLWYKTKNKSYPASYDTLLHKHIINVDIERLIAFYLGNKEMDTIEGVPVELEYYKNKDYIKTMANDTFNLLITIYNKYATTEYFVVDLNKLLNASSIYNKIRRDKYQLDVLYYGFVQLYFPMITYQVFIEYLKNERSLITLYPELTTSKPDLKQRHKYEQQITDEAYDASLDKKTIAKKLYSSIISTNLTIDNFSQDIEVLLVLRNIFDILTLTDTITYCKTHLLHNNEKILLKKSYFNEPEPLVKIPLNSLLIKIKTNPDTNEYMKLIIFKNGNYTVKTNWREENHMTFTTITNIVSKKINPIITMINKMGNRVKHHNVQIPLLDKRNVQFTETSYVFYYDDDITEARFNVFKNVLADYQRAGIIEEKENVVLGQEFFFRKGMYKYNTKRIEKSIALDNYYDYLSNDIAYVKWNTIFERTRLFQVLNVSSKLKISINGIRDDVETNFFHIYLVGMLHIYNKNAQHIKRIVGETVQTKSKKALKNLKTQDPLLYDFKKIYKSNVIYSKICQKPYQPLILSEREYKNLPASKKKNAIKYWNFTKEKSVWYSCPNAKYPYIKFIVKQHPKDYCIPCCKKIAMSERVNQKKQDIHNACLTKHIYTGEKVNLTVGSHYIATYGKDIDVGRISRLPEHTLEPLFFDTYSPDGGGIDSECITAEGYYLFGVDQHTAVIRNIGYLYCLVHSLNKSVDDFIKETVKKLRANPSKFRVLMDGDAGLYFKNNDEIANILSQINNENTMLHSRHERIPWNVLLMSIGYYFFGVNYIIFDDQRKERINLILPRDLSTTNEMFPQTHKNLVVLRKHKKFYPVYLINTEIFKRTGVIDNRLFLNESGLITTIQAVVRKHFETGAHEKIKKTIDMSIIKEFVKSNHTYKITHYFINYSNLCYAVLIKYKNQNIYFPISASHYSLNENIQMIFTPYNNTYQTDIKNLLSFFDQYNKWVRGVSKKQQMGSVDIYPIVQVEKWLALKKSNNIIGFVSKNMNYYCKPFNVSGGRIRKDAPINYMLYDPSKINKLIHSIKSGKKQLTTTKSIKSDLQRATYSHYLYQLILLQFINIFNKQKNTKLRNKLLSVLAKTNFDKSMEKLRTFIKKEITDIDDNEKIKSIIGRFLSDHHNKRTMVEDIRTSHFNFDKIGLERIKKLPQDKIIAELTKMAKTFTIISDKTTNNKVEFPNMLVVCDQKNKNVSYCKGNKFIVDKKQLSDIITIIAYDITNPFKWKWLFNSVFIDRYVNFFKFIRRPSETITVSFV